MQIKEDLVERGKVSRNEAAPEKVKNCGGFRCLGNCVSKQDAWGKVHY